MIMFFSPRHRVADSARSAASVWTAAFAAVVLSLGFVAASGAPAQADLGDPGQVTLDKTVDLASSTTASPGDTFTYGFLVGCDDNDCIDATLDDQLPSEFEGFTITGLQVSPPSAPVDVELTGCTEGGAVTSACLLHADFTASLGDLDGEPQVGIAAGVTYRVNVQLTVPTDLPATWAHNGVPVDNTATADADTSVNPAQDTATVTVEIPIVVDVEASKSWSPSSQLYEPGAESTFTIGTRNTSNLPAQSMVLQDPAVAPDGALTLDAANPFTFVDYVGLCSPASLPEGADQVQVDLYVLDGGAWTWVTGTPSATATEPSHTGEVGGLRLTYTSTTGATIEPAGDASAQCVTVKQREENRTTGGSLLSGATVNNTVEATLAVPDHDDATDTASAALEIGPLTVAVTPGKTIAPSVIPAGSSFDVALTAANASNGPLSELTVSEPGPSVDPFLSEDLTFGDFDTWTWPAGATGGSITWRFDSAADQTDTIDSAGAPTVPTPAGGDWITGFTVTYTGSIEQDASAGMTFSVDSDPTMIDNVAPFFEDFDNTIEVTGTNLAGTDSETAEDAVRVFYPEIEIALDKTVRPGLVTPGGTVVAELQATTATNIARVNPTQIVVEDVWDVAADADFWNAFRARELAFIEVPAGATLTVRYTTDAPAIDPITWIDLVVADDGGPDGLYSNDLSSLASGTADDITGFQFVFDNAEGFSQGTIVKPNIVFEAADTLRTGGPTTITPEIPIAYDNVATADGEGVSGGETIEIDEVEDRETTEIVSFGSGTGPGSLLVDKDWVQSNWTSDLNQLPSQSGSTARTAHGWSVTTPGYDRVFLSDSLPGDEVAPAGTAFDSFDLTGIRAVTFAQDPLLQWDQVTDVEIYVSGAWAGIPAPSGDWMSASGFKGYNPSGAALAQLRSATGVRITVEPNDAARAASTDPGRPDPGEGVAWSATERPLWLQWQLRNTQRSSGDWVTQDATLNGGEGTVRNDFRVTGESGTESFSADASDTLGLIDGVPGVGTQKVANPSSVVVPYPGDVDQADYPTVQFTVDAWNTATSRASYVRVTDPLPCPSTGDCTTAGSDRDPDTFTGNVYDSATNPFELFTITSVDFAVPSAVPIDASATQVALWRYNAGATTVDTMTMADLDALDAAALVDVVGIGIVYQSTDPATTGGLIPRGSATSNVIRMNIDTQLRSTERSTAEDTDASGISVVNEVLAQSYDPVLDETATPNASSTAAVALSAAVLDVTASKDLAPSEILETDPSVPVTVTLGATDGDATAAPEIVTLTDTTEQFWQSFELTALGDVTRPVGADIARVDVQLDGSSTWTQGTPVAAPADPSLPGSLTLPADLERITGVRYAFFNDPEAPFSATAPSADWSAEAVFTVRLREDAEFPGSVDNTVEAVADHSGLPAVGDSDADSITLSSGTARIDVQKEAVTGGPGIVEPGVSYPWTLEFTNTGSAFIPVNSVLDDLGPNLRYDGTAPIYETDAAQMPTTGINVTQSTAEELDFTFPDGAILAPGEWYRITVNLVLLPGLTPTDQAVNTFIVDTDATFAPGACTNNSGNGQGTVDGLPDNQCGTTNFVSPQAGPLLLAEKEVRGEVDGTLVDGASNVTDPTLPCVPSEDGFHRGTCVPYSAIGASDEWRIGAVNTGTTPYESLTFVDALPTPGDRMLATGGARGSDWRPVMDVDFGIQETTITGGLPGQGMPAGTTLTTEVTTDVSPCVGTGAGTAWPGDSTCTGNSWQALASYTGDAADITGIRVTLDFISTPDGALPPGGSVHFLYRTVNTPWQDGDIPTTDAVRPELRAGESPRAWNQVGVTAVQAGSGEPLRRAPARVGVQLLTGSAAVEKTISGATELAPEQVTVDAACTVPGGTGGGRVPVDLGELATLAVPTAAAVELEGIPLGAECSFVESGDLGDFGEVERTPSGPQTVAIDTVGGADTVPVAQSVAMDNRYERTESPSPGDLDEEGSLDEDDDSGGQLSNTGAEPLRLIVVALALMLIGLCLVAVRRRRGLAD
jgi:hypothetical protein